MPETYTQLKWHKTDTDLWEALNSQFRIWRVYDGSTTTYLYEFHDMNSAPYEEFYDTHLKSTKEQAQAYFDDLVARGVYDDEGNWLI